MSWKYLNNPDLSHQRLGLILVTGIVVVQYWAQLFNLGEVYGGGRIWSASLLFGPLLALIFPWVAALTYYYGRIISHGPEKVSFNYKMAYVFLTFAFRPLLWFGFVQLFELTFFGENPFSAKWDFFLVVKTLLILATLVLWFFYSRKLEKGRKGWPIFALVSLISGLGMAIFLLRGIFNLPIVA